MNYQELCNLAIKATENSYTPYSDFCVGAALLCADGSVYCGCNIENSSYTPTVCAERVAIFKAISDGKRDFSAIAVAGGKRGNVGVDETAPCGVCLQVMSEFCDADFKVILVKGDGFSEYKLSDLLPKSFKLE